MVGAFLVVMSWGAGCHRLARGGSAICADSAHGVARRAGDEKAPKRAAFRRALVGRRAVVVGFWRRTVGGLAWRSERAVRELGAKVGSRFGAVTAWGSSFPPHVPHRNELGCSGNTSDLSHEVGTRVTFGQVTFGAGDDEETGEGRSTGGGG